MSTNKQLADLFNTMAAVLEINGSNRFKFIAYQKAARTLKDLAHEIAPQAKEDPKSLTEIEGIGKGLADKIVEHVNTGNIQEIDEELAKVPPGVIQLLNIPGLGPKTVQAIWKQAKVESLADLKAAIESGELEALPRMGKKTIENLRKSIAFAESAGDRALIGVATNLANEIIAHLSKLKHVKKIDYAGSLRRGCETIGDIDILVATDNPEKHGPDIAEAFQNLPNATETIAAGKTKTSIRLEQNIQADLRIIPPDRYGAALLYFTGSKQHNVALREKAIKRLLRLNEYGLFKAADVESKSSQEATPIAAVSEEEIYDTLHLDFIPPELREDRGEFALADHDNLPELVQLKDIKAELHAHTTASDGKWTIEALAQACIERGFHTVAITDHSHSQTVANGLDPERLKKHIAAIRKANDSIKEINILAGTEVDILADGSLDYENELLAELDLVVASPHSALTQDPDKATARLLKAIENPYVHIIGHPTGRIINRREGLSPDLPTIFKAAAATNTTLEINSNQLRLDLRDTHAKAAIEAGVLLAINTDAHHPDHLDQLIFGVLTARRAYATKKHIINALTNKQLQTYLAKKRKNLA